MQLSRLLVAAFAASVVLFARDSDACSCMGPQETLVTPSRVDDVPLNTKVRVEIPPMGAGRTNQNAKIVLRVHGGKTIDVTTRTNQQGDVDLHELTPTSALTASTQYEVAVIDPHQHPSTTVIGTFKTGTTTDTVAPTLDSITLPTPIPPGPNKVVMLTSCSVSGPRVTFESVTASDPTRAKAQLLYGVWLGDASGKIDPSKPPTRLLSAYEKSLTVGRSSSCSHHDFPFPSTPFAWVGVAAIDEAGNRSALKTFRIDVKAVTLP